MNEKATIFQNIQFGIETTPGIGVPANKKLQACNIIPQPRTESNSFRAIGNKYPSFVTLNKEWAELALDGKMTFNEIVYLLSSLLVYPTPVQQGSTAAYKWTFVSNTSAEDSGKYLTIERGDANSAWRVVGAKVSGMTLTFNRGEVGLNGTGVAQAFETGVTLTASPTSLSPVPLLPTMLTLKMADTQAGLAGATPLTRSYSLEFSLTDKFGLNWPVGQSPVAVEGEPKLSAKLKLATDAIGMGLIATMRAGATKWFRLKATGALIATPYYQDFQLDFPAQIDSAGDMSDQENILAVEYGLTPVHDVTWGKAFQIDVTTNVSAL